ncbi:MAG: cyclic nucleotide-binding domain-containing protein [Elusimicrobiota bacterium]
MIEKLKELKAFKIFPDDILRAMSNFIVIENFSAGEIIFREGKPGSASYIIGKGQIAVKKQKKLLGVFTKGDMFGEMALYEAPVRSATAIAKTDTTLYKLNNKSFKEFIFKHTETGVQFLFNNIKEMSERLRRTSRYFIMVYETGKLVGQEISLKKLTRKILSILSDGIDGITGGAVFIKNPFTELYQPVFKTEDSTLKNKKIEELVNSSREKFTYQEGDRYILGTSMAADDKILGYIVLEKDKKTGNFTIEDEIILNTVCNQVGLGIIKSFKKQEDKNREKLSRRKNWSY